MPSDRHQHQTEARTTAEARVAAAKKAFDDQSLAFDEQRITFSENAGEPLQLEEFYAAWKKLFSCANDLDEAKRVLSALDRSIP